MKTIDLNQLMQEDKLSRSEAREMLRRRLKDGFLWSRLNPDLLMDQELLPVLTVDEPPASAAELVPFPVPADRYENFDPDKDDPFEYFAEEKIRWCSQGQKTGSAIYRRVIKQMQYYELVVPVQGTRYYWMDLDPLDSPYRPLLNTVLPALDKYSLANPVPPQPPQEKPGESWYSPEADDYGVRLHFSGTVEDSEAFSLSVSLTGKTVFWLRTYKLNYDRYRFIRQQIFFLLGARLEPWQGGDMQRQSTFRGMVYRKPKKS